MWNAERQDCRSIAFGGREANDAIVIWVYARAPRQGGFPAARGRIAFEMLLAHFREERPVPAIEASWSPSSDNHAKFFALRASADDQTAALGTWTGEQAARAGYGRVVDIELRGEVVRVRFEP